MHLSRGSSLGLENIAWRLLAAPVTTKQENKRNSPPRQRRGTTLLLRRHFVCHREELKLNKMPGIDYIGSSFAACGTRRH